MTDPHGYSRRRFTWDYSASATPQAVAGALRVAAGHPLPSGWEPEQLLMTGWPGGFRIHLDLAPEATDD